VQPEGDRQARGVGAAIGRVVAHVAPLPVIAKETGAGMDRRAAERLAEMGVAALDVGGEGGTSFAAVEGLRAAAQGDAASARLGELLRDWGIPTPVSVLAVRPVGLPIIATGGIRSGLDAARALAMGAAVVGVARPLLRAALAGDAAVDAWITQFVHELRTVLQLCGARDVAELRRDGAYVVTGTTWAWIQQLQAAGTADA
jgi:isopentenyl-diphosphate delta-isomerase